MARLRPPGFYRSAGFRLAISYAALFGASALLLVAVLWVAGTSIITRQVDEAIDSDAQGLAEQWHEGGPERLLDTIAGRIKTDADRDAFYLVLDPFGRRVAGNLPSWPAEVEQTGLGYEVDVVRDGVRNLARFHRYGLPLGYSLLIGREVEGRATLRTLLTQTLAWALLLVGMLSLAGARLMQLLFRRMISQVALTAEAVSAGDLSRRVAITGRGDEFDRVAESINDMLERLSRLMDGVRQVSNAIAHDLRTPITRARARLEDAAAHAADAGVLREAVERAVDDLDAVTNVFQALLRIAEIEAGARRSSFAVVAIAPVLDEVAELYGPLAEDAGLTLEADAAGALTVLGDAALLRQAVANLVDNAIKFSPPGGKVRLGAERSGAELRLVVSDAGPGIPEAERGRASERFYRGEAARSTPGFGLGLALVRAVATLHGGALRLEDASPGLRAVLAIPAG